MTIYLGLGANLGDRRDHLEQALDLLDAGDVRVLRVSPVVETPALLPEDAPDDWNRPYLNLVAECAHDGGPQALLARCKMVEHALGRDNPARWSPRPIDIDILLHDRDEIQTQSLTVPHPAMHERAFVLAPLAALAPGLTIPGRGSKTVLEWARALEQRIPLWMGILNLTPDSFSDGGRFVAWPDIERHVDDMVEAGAQIIDVGAESTRPGATPLVSVDERSRLEPVLERLVDKYRGRRLKPLLSVDTYHVEVAAAALERGVDIINDVGGLESKDMIALAASSRADWVAMHRLSLPANRQQTLPTGEDPVEHVARWVESQLAVWQRAGLDKDRIIIDPGVGFGKTALQSQALLRGHTRLERYGLRQLIGHSRKSFLAGLAGQDMAARDLNTIGVSLQLIGRGVEILRVHNVRDHVSAYRGWSHVR